MKLFEAKSANLAWQKAVDHFRSAEVNRHAGRGGDTREIIPACFQVSNPLNRWIFGREPAISVAFALVEIVGIMNGRNDSEYLNYFNPLLPQFAGTGAVFHGAYGFRLRRNFGLDQLKRAADTLVSLSESRQVVLQIWDAQLDLPESDGKPRAADIPCNVCSMLKVRDGNLTWTQVMRSNDLFRGTPYNFVQFTSLQEVLAGWIGTDTGPFTLFADSLHVYERDLQQLIAYSSPDEPVNTDSLADPYEKSQKYWDILNNCASEFPRGLSGQEIEDLVSKTDLPKAYLNFLRIIAADAARRSRERELAVELGQACDNPALRYCWERWYERKEKKRLGRAT